jgi:hypothetical protein
MRQTNTRLKSARGKRRSSPEASKFNFHTALPEHLYMRFSDVALQV